jgi:hypothetical protein
MLQVYANNSTVYILVNGSVYLRLAVTILGYYRSAISQKREHLIYIAAEA